MLRSIFGFNWRSSPAHLLLLSKFLSPRDPGHYYDDENWEAVLEEKPKKTIQRFLKEGLIEQAELAGLLSHKYKVTELKELLRERDLKVSGRKAALIERLIEADPNAMKKAVHGLSILQCTAEGREVAEQYKAEERAKREQVEQHVFQALQQGEFKEASQAVAAYEAQQVFSRGLGMDWSNHDPKRDVEVLETVFSGKPKILDRLTDEQLGPLRIAAGMMYLWGTRLQKEWLPVGFETDLRLDNDTAARMLYFYATHQRRLHSYQDHVEKVRILDAGDSSCENCRKLSRKEYSLEEVPELPYEKCTHEMGCRCRIVAASFSDY